MRGRTRPHHLQISKYIPEMEKPVIQLSVNFIPISRGEGEIFPENEKML